VTLDEVAGRLQGAKQKRIQGANGYEALCPCHDDHNPSLHIWEGDNGWIKVKCRSCGAESKDFCQAVGIENRDLNYRPDPSKSKKPSRGKPTREHHYFRANGDYAFTKQVWVGENNKKDMLKVVKESPASSKVLRYKVDEEDKGLLYNLPQVLKAIAEGRPVHIGEGEKAADKLAEAGEVGTCQQDGGEVLEGGKSRWRDAHSEVFTGAMVFVWADRDEVGEWYASEVCASLNRHGAMVFPVQSKTANPKDDAYDHLAAGHDPLEGIEFDAYRREAPKKKPVKVEMGPAAEATIEVQLEGRDRPEVYTNGVQYRDVQTQVYAAIVRRNDPPTLFVRNGTLAIVSKHDGEDTYKILDAADHDLRSLASQACDFVKSSEKKGVVASDPPGKVEAMIRAMRPWPDVPHLEGLSQCPVLRPDGTFATEQGYDKETKTCITLGPWPKYDLDKKPIDFILEEVLCDFPFDSEASRDGALALMLLPFLRRTITGPTPMHYIDAPTQGSGKTLLAQACLYPACGTVPASTLPEREEERKKSISSFLLEGAQAVIFDNVDKRVDSGTLAAATTNDRYHDRLLGSNAVIDVPVNTVWAMTSNNADLNRDMTRRTVWIRLDAKMERPEQGRTFKHKRLHKWLADNRQTIVAACCQIVKDWVDAGRPVTFERTMGSFEHYAAVLGSVLAVQGRHEFLANQFDLEEHSDSETIGWRSFHAEVYESRGDSWWKTRDILEIADEIDELGFALGSNADGKRIKFGKALERRDKKIVGGLMLEKSTVRHGNARLFRIVPTADYDPFAEGSVPRPRKEPVQSGLPYKDDSD